MPLDHPKIRETNVKVCVQLLIYIYDEGNLQVAVVILI